MCYLYHYIRNFLVILLYYVLPLLYSLKGQLKDYSKSAIGQVVTTFDHDQWRNL